LNPEWLRYYIAAKLNANVEDIDFSPDDFVARVNSDLIGKYVNIASRAANFITRHFHGELRYSQDMAGLSDAVRTVAAEARDDYEAREFGKAMRACMAFADGINQYFDANRHLMTRVDPKQLDSLFESDAAAAASAGGSATAVTAPGAAALNASGSGSTATVSLDEFKRVDLRVARILDAQAVAGADKLLK